MIQYNGALIANNLKDAIKRSGMSQYCIAEKADISLSTLQSYLSDKKGHKNPSLQNIIRLAEVLDISIDDLCGRTFKGPAPILQRESLYAFLTYLEKLYQIDQASFSFPTEAFSFDAFITLSLTPLTDLLKACEQFWRLKKNEDLENDLYKIAINSVIEKYESSIADQIEAISNRKKQEQKGPPF